MHSAITASPCPQHETTQAGCGACRTRAAVALDIIDKLAALITGAETCQSAVRDQRGFAEALARLGDRLGGDELAGLIADLDEISRRWRSVASVLAARLALLATAAPRRGCPDPRGPGSPPFLGRRGARGFAALAGLAQLGGLVHHLAQLGVAEPDIIAGQPPGFEGAAAGCLTERRCEQ